jgi:glycosyltransferase involved in cell wall biosynthesis
MINSKPKVFIALPVYNNISYIKNALDSLLDQSYNNIIIYIYDNHSTDGTSEFCKSYSQANSKVEYHCNNSNVKSAENFRKALLGSVSYAYDYFMYARGDATISKNLILDLVNMLESDQRASLAFPKMEWVNVDNIEIKNKKIGFYDTSGYNVETRVSLLLMTKPNQIYGLIRANMVMTLHTEKWWQIVGFDHVFLCELALKGHFRHMEDGRFFRQYKYDNEVLKNRMQRYRETLLIRPDVLDKTIPLVKIPFYLIKTVLCSKLNIGSKFKCIFVILLVVPLRFLISKNEKI